MAVRALSDDTDSAYYAWAPMRVSSSAPVPWRSALVVLVRVGANAVQATNRIGMKRQLLLEADPEELLLVCWPGLHRQETFVVDDRPAALTALEPASKRP